MSLLHPLAPLPLMDRDEHAPRPRILSLVLAVFAPSFVLLAFLVRFVVEPALGWLNPEFLFSVALGAVLTLAFVMNRRGHYMPAALLTVLSVLAAVFLANHFTLVGVMEPEFRSDDVNLLCYLVVPLMLAAALLPVRTFGVILVLSLAGVALTPVWYSHVTLDSVLQGPFLFLVVVVVLLTALTHALSRQARARVGELTRSEQRFRSLFEQSLDPIIVLDRQGVVRDINPAAVRVLGYERDELVGNLAEIVYANPSDRARLARIVEEQGYLYEEQAKLRTRAGRVVDCILTVWARRDPRGRTVEYQTIARDVTEQLRSEAELRLRGDLLELAFDPIMLIDPGGEIVQSNVALSALTGYSPEDLAHMNVRQLDAPEETEEVPSRIGRLLREGALDFDSTWVCKDGSRVIMEVRARTIEAEGRPLFLSVARDVTRRKRDESELRLRGELLDLSTDHVLLHDLKGKILYVNHAVAAAQGYAPAEMVGRSMAEVLPREEMARFQGRLARMMTGEDVTFEVRVCHRNGADYADVDVTGRLIEIDGQPLVLSVGRDVTERKRVREELLKSEQMYRELFEQSMDAVAVFAPEGVLLDANPAYIRLFGTTPDEIGRNVVLDYYVNPADRAEFLGKLERDGVVLDQEVQLRKRDGTVMDCVLTSVARRNEEGRISSIQTVIRDITERKKAEQELRDREQKYHELFEQSLDAVCLVSVDGTLLDANRAWFELYGWSSDAIGRVNVRKFYVDPSRRERLLRTLDEQGGLVDVETRQRKADGTEFVCLMSLVARRDASGRMVALQAVSRDITEQKRAQQELAESELRFRSLLENTGAGILVTRSNGEILECNAAAQAMFGRTRDEMLRTRTPDLHADLDERGRLMRQFKRDGFLRAAEIEVKRGDGAPVYVAQTSTWVPLAGEQVIMSELVDVTERRRAEQELRESRERLQMLTAYLEDARERERAGIARELHDQLGQALTALRLDLDAIVHQNDEGEHLSGERLAGMSKLLDDTVVDVRRISSELRPGILDDVGLLAAIEWQLGQWAVRTGIEYSFHSESDDKGLDRARSTALFRVLQELLTNVARHSGATALDVGFVRRDGRFVLEARDNGRGITADELNSFSSLGLIGMRERLRPFGGQLDLTGEPGKGTTAIVSVPAL